MRDHQNREELDQPERPYLAAPTRLCAYYPLDQQPAVGSALIAITAALGVSWFVAVFIGSPPFWSKGNDGPSHRMRGATSIGP